MRINFNTDDIISKHNENLNIIDNGELSIFIAFAKKYNIFKQSNSKFYDMMCDKIKARLDREGLDYEIVRPE